MMTSKLYTAQQYADLLKSRVGKKYVLGQPIPYNKPDPDALDCSGLIIWANNISGAMPMGDDTAAGLYNRSKAVVGEPTVGDMVFLRNNPARSNGIGHMAVITAKLSNGDYRIIEARGRASGVVSTTLSYWKTRKYYTGIRRLPNFKLATETTEPPVTPLPKVTKFNVSTYNCVDTRFGGKINDDGAVVRALASSINLLTEAPEAVRNAIRVARGGKDKFLVWTREDSKSQAILFEKAKWSHTTKGNVVFGPTSYHGAVVAVLTHKATKLKVQFACLHMPPSKIYSSTAEAEKARKKYFKKLIDALDPKLPTVIGGDFNSSNVESWAKEYGYIAAPTGATTNSGKRLDWLLIKGGQFDKVKVIDAGKASDHKAVKAQAIFGAIDTR